MSYETLDVERENHIVKVSFNRPETYNAINGSMVTELASVLEEIENNPDDRVMILSGKGKAFCTGVDLKFVNDECKNLADQESLFRRLNSQVKGRIEKMPKPTIAAINGYALAGGFELMMACDLAIASEEAKIGDQHINYGLVGPGGSTQITPRYVGIRKAKELIFTGDKISADEAERIGLINKVAAKSEFENEVIKMATTIAEKSPVALKFAKRLVNRSVQVDEETTSELEVLSALLNCTSDDYQEGIEAFNQKRKPVFKGR